ncbi:hypothetical protein BJI67_16470 (plasmid) [Acidihalobacter aeolianus]|uniref:Uncharacterized protein n=1 Tax=Acidihalobacter aeolianus TaxID=2792603 RepID=A0A1D8KD20_9GAMM|nr:hypothetical protein [Acidihalobacter aeolianus]AOV18832.1 hypothetical protein BJI67_16470 [Acidihalobacter aeolianus]
MLINVHQEKYFYAIPKPVMAFLLARVSEGEISPADAFLWISLYGPASSNQMRFNTRYETLTKMHGGSIKRMQQSLQRLEECGLCLRVYRPTQLGRAMVGVDLKLPREVCKDMLKEASDRRKRSVEQTVDKCPPPEKYRQPALEKNDAINKTRNNQTGLSVVEKTFTAAVDNTSAGRRKAPETDQKKPNEANVYEGQRHTALVPIEAYRVEKDLEKLGYSHKEQRRLILEINCALEHVWWRGTRVQSIRSCVNLIKSGRWTTPLWMKRRAQCD